MCPGRCLHGNDADLRLAYWATAPVAVTKGARSAAGLRFPAFIARVPLTATPNASVPRWPGGRARKASGCVRGGGQGTRAGLSQRLCDILSAPATPASEAEASGRSMRPPPLFPHRTRARGPVLRPDRRASSPLAEGPDSPPLVWPSVPVGPAHSISGAGVPHPEYRYGSGVRIKPISRGRHWPPCCLWPRLPALAVAVPQTCPRHCGSSSTSSPISDVPTSQPLPPSPRLSRRPEFDVLRVTLSLSLHISLTHSL